MAKFQYGLVLLCFVLLASMAAAKTQFKVGGSKGWAVPDPNAISFNQWAEENRFQIGDSLLFVYPPDQDSVLLVDANAYNTCDTSSSIDLFDDGNTVFTFTRSGPSYFISGKGENCRKNEKLVVVVVVMASRGNGTSLEPSPSPVSSSSPPAPPSGIVEIEPSSTPAGEESTAPPNGASVKAVEFMGTLGAVLVAFHCVLSAFC